MTTQKKPILPGPYPIKIIAQNKEAVTQAVLAVIEKSFPGFDNSKTQYNRSEGSQYVSTTVIVHAENEEQLKKLHLELKAIDGVILVI